MVNLLERRRTLLTDHIDSLRNAFAQAKAARPFLMPFVPAPETSCRQSMPSGKVAEGT
jgi:hypothetical protein